MATDKRHGGPGLGSLFVLRGDDPELARSQLAALAKQLPLLYLLLCVNSITLGLTHAFNSPLWLALAWPCMMCVLAALRSAAWARFDASSKPDSEIDAHLRVIMILVIVLGIGSTIWSLSLYPYGDAYAKCHVAFYLAITVITVILCLTYMPNAAFLLTCIVVIPFTIFFGLAGNPVMFAMVVNLLLVSGALIFITLRNFNAFAALVTSERSLLARQNEMQRLADENHRLANMDALTGLPNRRSFLSALEAALEQAKRDGSWFAVTMMDLDGFKGVNDTYGHGAGDRLLTEVGERLGQAAGGSVLVARLGGDEFGAILHGNPSPERVREFGDTVCAALEAPFGVGDGQAAITCSLGAAIYPAGGHTAAELFEHADYAL